MSENKVNPAENLEEDELSLEELEAQAGGSSDVFENSIVMGDAGLNTGVDSSYTSYQGALGTLGNESHKFHSKPLDVQVNFP
ncbi:hypothetical protein [Anabaena sp. PCC 7108]|uniref:hypothetical protein n=1 Tax=Anabaena sp. PCC 7108 TaxID=163908 RepID=UPI000380BF42|nr:hypothetical protein [Anabaena sp. PCC 7108]